MRFNPFRLSEHLIESSYRIPIYRVTEFPQQGESFMTADKNMEINLGEYLDFLRRWGMSDKREEKEGIKSCPFCEGEGRVIEVNDPPSNDGYYQGYDAYVVKCTNCKSTGREIYIKFFRDFTKYDLAFFLKNPDVAASERLKFSNYRDECRRESIKYWNGEKKEGRK